MQQGSQIQIHKMNYYCAKMSIVSLLWYSCISVVGVSGQEFLRLSNV